MAKKINGDPGVDDFLEMNPGWKVFSFVKDMEVDYAAFVSDILWACYYLHHPESPYSEFLLTEKKEAIQQDFLKTKRFRFWDITFDSIKESFVNVILTREMRRYKIWDDQFDKLTFEVNILTLKTPEERKEFKDLAKGVLEIQKALDAFKAMVLEKEISATNKGGEEGASDSGSLYD